MLHLPQELMVVNPITRVSCGRFLLCGKCSHIVATTMWKYSIYTLNENALKAHNNQTMTHNDTLLNVLLMRAWNFPSLCKIVLNYFYINSAYMQ